MSDTCNYSVQGNIALIIMNQPPVNGLGQALRSAIIEQYRQASADDAVDAIVLGSAAPIFCGGADIAEFAAGTFMDAPDLPNILNEIEASEKLVVAAINGAALGGGLETALACDYRFAHPAAVVGLPEVSLGIIPGAGGTQRLPRLAGPKTAVEMITSGRPIKADAAKAAGIVDEVFSGDGDFIDAAVAYTRRLLGENAPVKSCADLGVDSSDLEEGFFEQATQQVTARNKGFFAPGKCVEAVEFACNSDLATGLKKEAELFTECHNTPQARAQQHLFFAERAASKIPGVDRTTPIRAVNKVAVIGSGTMGGGIAMNFVNIGIPVTILDLNPEALDRGLAVVRKNYEVSAKKGRLTDQQVEERMALLSGTTDYADLADADMVIEAVFEKMEIKKTVFKTLDEVCKPGAILASNTSTLDLNEIAAATSRPQDVIGMHFFSPANVMKLLEVVRGDKTAADVILSTLKIAQKIKKVPIVVGVCFGFVGNRMLEPYGREAMRMILEGATPQQIDNALMEYGYAMGMPSMLDLAGIDVSWLARQGVPGKDKDPSYCAIGDKLYELGRYGQKTGRGYYIYEGRDKKPDPEVMELAAELAKQYGIEQRSISNQEIVERMIFNLVNEGARILEEGIAYRSGDCDLIYIYGYGFPAFRGGPMQYADEIGLKTVLDGLNKYRSSLGQYGEMWFKPAPLLEKLASEGKSFSSFSS